MTTAKPLTVAIATLAITIAAAGTTFTAARIQDNPYFLAASVALAVLSISRLVTVVHIATSSRRRDYVASERCTDPASGCHRCQTGQPCSYAGGYYAVT